MAEVMRPGRDLEPDGRVPAWVDESVAQHMDQMEFMAAILAQRSGPAQVIHGPEWSAQVIPPALPGTVQATYTKAMLPVRVVAFFFLWMSWDWKRGAFVAVAVVLIGAIVLTR